MGNGCGVDLEPGQAKCLEHHTQEQEYNSSETQRMRVRAAHERMAAQKAVLNYSTIPYATQLLQQQPRFKAFVDSRPLNHGGQYPQTQTFRQILIQPINNIIALDSACGIFITLKQ